MVALRNVIDGQGNQVLTMGGVYSLSYPMCDGLHEIDLNSNEWTGLDVPSLVVRPNTFLQNESFFDYLSESDLKKISPPSPANELWPSILEGLDRVRAHAEAQRSP